MAVIQSGPVELNELMKEMEIMGVSREAAVVAHLFRIAQIIRVGMEQMDKKEMPIPGYFYLGRHSDAKLTNLQYKKLYAYFEGLRDGSWASRKPHGRRLARVRTTESRTDRTEIREVKQQALIAYFLHHLHHHYQRVSDQPKRKPTNQPTIACC